MPTISCPRVASDSATWLPTYEFAPVTRIFIHPRIEAFNMLTRRTKCRLCESEKLELSVKLPLTTIADHYRAAGEKQMPLYPLDIYRCEACGHIQLLDILPPAVLFDAEFTYMPSRNPALIEHFKMYADLVANLLGDHPASVCLDIGSNDGLFLQTLKARFGSQTLGIDPAHAPAEYARSQGVETWEEFFSNGSVQRIKERFEKVDVISANNVFAHNDDLISFATNVASLMHDGSVFSFEFSYLVDVVEKGLIGTVFHEHVSTHSLLSLIPFLNRCGLELIDIKRIDTQGGAAIGFAKLLSAKATISESVSSLLLLERKLGLDTDRGIKIFRDRIMSDKIKVAELLKPYVGEIVGGFGAARSANLLIDFFELGPLLNFIIDDSPQKCGKWLNAYEVPILPNSSLVEKIPKVMVCLAWIHTEKITARLKETLGQTVKVLQLYPEIKLV